MLSALLFVVACGANGESSSPNGAGTAEPTPAEGTATPNSSAPEGSTSFDPADRLLVAASFAILADIAANVGGERIEVWSVTPPTADPHTYEASPRDLARLSDADYLLMVGGRFEAFAERTAWRRAARDADLPTFVVTDTIDVIVRDVVIDHGDHTHDFTGGDPHFWLDPQRVLELLPELAAVFSELDPEGTAYFEENARRYAEAVREADAELEAAIASIPPERRVLVVYHDAYGYLEERFDFQVLGSILPTTGGGEASAGNLADIHRQIEAHGVQAVFREPQFQSSILDGLARDHGIAVGILMTDAFSDDAETYVDLIRFNAATLAQHLG